MTLALMTCNVVIGPLPDILDGIAHADAALAIWARDLPAGLGDTLASLDLDEIDDVAITVAADGSLDEALNAAGYSDAVAAPIAADIVSLARHHAALTGTGRLSLRLEVVETDACRRFHADYVTLRMICTYVGPGTQWHRGAEPDVVGTVPTGAVAVFKGRMLLDPPTVLHRSPPIMASGERRLMLVVDPA